MLYVNKKAVCHYLHLSIFKVLLGLFLTYPLMASTYIVDNNPSCTLFTCTNCTGASYSSIFPGNNKTTVKAAINAATDDWTGTHSIKICPGSYNESNIDFDTTALSNSVIESTTGNRNDVRIYANSNNPILKITASISGMTLRNVSIENTNGRGIYHSSGTLQNSTFQNLSIVSKNESFDFDSPANITFEDIDLTSTNADCFYVKSPSGTMNINTLNQIYNTFTCKENGIYLGNQSQNYSVSHTKIKTTASDVASITMSKANSVVLDDIDSNSSNQGSGIWVDGTVNSVIVRNSKIHNIKNEAIYVKSITSPGSVFENNVIDSGSRGIYLKNFSNPVTIQNNIIQNTVYGIYLLDNASWRGSQIDSNCFIRNTNHAFSRDQNAYFDNGSEGNYWDTWSGSGAYTIQNIPKYDNHPRSYCPLITNTLPIPSVDYRMDECSWSGTAGEVKDSSGNDYNATAKGTTLPQLSNQIINNGSLFQRTNQQYVQVPTLQINKPNFNDGFTVTAWAKFSGNASDGSWERIFDFGNGDSANNIFLGRQDTSNNLVLGIHESTSGDQYLVATGAISDTNWHLWAVSCNGASCILYKDGVNIASSTTMKIPSNIARTSNYIGKSNWPDAYFEGGIDEFKVFDESLSTTQIATIYANELAKKNYDGNIRNGIVCKSICKSIKDEYATTTNGYYYVNEAIASAFNLKPFEIYCEGMNTDTNITQYLPTVINQSNSANSNFKFNAIVNSKYYTSTDKTYFKKIKIDENVSAASDFMTSGFSNINLVGTPFQLDLDNTTFGTCDSATDRSKLRIGHYNQAIKIDPTIETKTYCTASKMPFKQISNYYAKDAHSNLTTCAQIAQNSTSRPPSGYYLLKKAKQTVGEGNYIVAYCEMNPPVEKQIWTLFLALDAQTTDQKSDVVNGNDTCSRVGYSFFTPNQKSVMDAARGFLYDRKSEWSDYTGTVKEYFTDYGIEGWATNDTTSIYKPNPIPNGPMWPYGPFGIYKPTGAGSSGNKLIAMSTTFLSAVDKNDSFGSLDSIGWKSVLPEISPTYTDTWWVTDIAAGYARNTSGHLVSVASSIEPNGDYDANNWMGWFADTNGYIIHYNDQNGANRYRYSNYMCTSQDMYTIVDTSWDTWGFDAWDLTKSISLRTISTKKVAENFSLTIASLNSANTALSDFNGTVCVRIVDDTNLSLNGSGTSLYFNGIQTKTASNFNITKAVKDARVLLNWKENVNTTCPLSADANRTLATDNFAIRPDRFTISNATQAFAGENFPLDFKALNTLSANSANYNETKDSSFEINAVIGRSGCDSGTFTVSNFSFMEGQKSAVDTVFSDVGDINITIAEKVGSEFAKIDISDTSDTSRLISPAILVVTVDPYELVVTDANFTASTGQNWLYDANVSDMFVTAHATVQANNMQHVEVLNFTNACYAQPVDLTFFYDVNNTNANTNLSYVTVNGAMVSPSKLFNDLNKTITIPTSLFTTSHASADYRFNVDRAFNIPLSPIDMALREVQVALPPVSKIVTNRTAGIGQHFYYGRVKTKDVVTDKTLVPHLLHVEVYSPTIAPNGFYQSSLNWYINASDDGTTGFVDGNFSGNRGFINNQPSTSIAVTGSGVLTDGILRFNINNLLGEQTSTVHVDVPYWLWNSNIGDYNNSAGSTCANHPCFNYKYSRDVDAIGIRSGTPSGSTIGKDYNASYQKTGVKTFR